jgi:glutaredoxin 3
LEVKIYSTPTCPYCVAAKEFFKSKSIDFTDIDVASDETKAQEMIDLSGQMGVPVIDIDGQVIVGFDRGKIEKLTSK